jgi:hypothetical protein
MTPVQLFASGPAAPQWIHGSDVGVDEDGKVWVKASANLRPDLNTAFRVCPLKDRPVSLVAREYAAVTPQRFIAIDPRHRSEPIWDHVHELSKDSIGQEWIAVA